MLHDRAVLFLVWGFVSTGSIKPQNIPNRLYPQHLKISRIPIHSLNVVIVSFLSTVHSE